MYKQMTLSLQLLILSHVYLSWLFNLRCLPMDIFMCLLCLEILAECSQLGYLRLFVNFRFHCSFLVPLYLTLGHRTVVFRFLFASIAFLSL